MTQTPVLTRSYGDIEYWALDYCPDLLFQAVLLQLPQLAGSEVRY